MEKTEKTLQIETNIDEHPQLSLQRVMNEFTQKFKELQIIGNTLEYKMGIEISEEVNDEIREGIIETLEKHGLSYLSLRYENNKSYQPEKISA